VDGYSSIGSSNRSAGTDDNTGSGNAAFGTAGIGTERGTGESVSAGAGEELYGGFADGG
jgi:hypothetical protein